MRAVYLHGQLTDTTLAGETTPNSPNIQITPAQIRNPDRVSRQTPSVLWPLRDGTVYASVRNYLVKIDPVTSQVKPLIQYGIYMRIFGAITNDERRMYFLLQNHPGEFWTDTVYTYDLGTEDVTDKLVIGDIYGVQFPSGLALTHDDRYIMIGADIFGDFWATLIDAQENQAIAKIVLDSLQFPLSITTKRCLKEYGK